jgi:hypothetical protein
MSLLIVGSYPKRIVDYVRLRKSALRGGIDMQAIASAICARAGELCAGVGAAAFLYLNFADPRYYVQAKPETRVIKGRAGIRVIVWARRRHVSSLVNLKFAQLKDSHAARTYRFLAT